MRWQTLSAREPAAILGLKAIETLVPMDFSRPQLAIDRPSFESWVGTWEKSARQRLELDLSSPAPGLPGSPAPTDFLPPPPIKLAKAATDTAAGPDGILSQYGDLGMRVVGRGEMGGAWNRFSPCDPTAQGFNCNPGLFPQLRPDVRFGVLVGGTISERVHVSVDYDQSREFDAANNINLYYQGMEDEILQRLEVGDVSIRLPSSRYLTRGVPSGNFGFKATGQLGPMDFQTVWAQQRGDVTRREFQLAGAGNASGLVQNESVVMDDADYVKGQFFFLVQPTLISGAPHIDAIALQAFDAPEIVRPGAGTDIEVYRDERPSALNQAQQATLGYFLADAFTADDSRKHSGQFRRLEREQDYVVHPSGLWIMLRAPLRPDEALAVSYQTEVGDTVGTLNAEASPIGVTPRLRLVRGPTSMHQPGMPTWDYEMHNVYRVHSSNTVDLSTVQLSISLGEKTAGRTFVTAPTGQHSYIKLFGLDEDAPADALDAAQIFQPSRNEFNSSPSTGARITGTYVIFPTLRPFAAPPPVPSAQLTAEEARQVLGNDANAAIYDDPDPLTRESTSRFRVNLDYRVTMEGLVSSFSLGAIGIRDNSEKITVGDRTLVRGEDYDIDYEIGMVTLNDAQSLFATNPDAQIGATFEQNSLFQIAPTSVFGFNTHYRLGTRGELNLVGLYQNEKSIMTRPQLGVEPGSIFLGGTSGRFEFGGALLDRALARVPGLRFAGASAVNLTGEMAFSMPNPNTRNEAYVDDFEASDEMGLSMRRRDWVLGSRPAFMDGAHDFLPGVLTAENAAKLVWQHDILQSGAIIGPLLPSQIDKQIRIAGAETPEPVLWLTLGDQANPIAGRRWRSLTTALSTTGADMTRTEFLEFYVKAARSPGQALIIDIGTVSEDAFYFDANGLTDGQYEDGTRWGLGFLDAEARLAERELWSTEKDALGLWNWQCQGAINGSAVPLGDESANCPRLNGLMDTEDLDGNGILDDSEGSYHRYVVPLDDISPYLVRNTDQTGTNYQLYRIPLRDGIPVNGASDATWRFVKHMRMTVTTANPSSVPDNITLARMRVIGSRWIKRNDHGVNRGLLSDEAGSPGTEVRVTPVSRLTSDDYVTPPLVGEQLQDPTQGLGASGIEFNEKGLSIEYTGLLGGDRAEVYFRYPQQPRSFLNYRQLSMWALAKRGDWTGDEKLVIKVGTDARNYYLFQTSLSSAVGDRPVTQADWLPQVVIDFEKWFDLKARAELELIQNPRTSNEPFVMFSEDSSYAIVMEDRSRAPNLAAIRELTFAVYNGGLGSADGEVWLNDIRLGTAFKDPGMAGNMALEIRGGDFINANITYANQGPLFRQLNQDAGYLAMGDLSINTSAQLGNLLPAGWGMDIPMTVSHARNNQDPMLLQQSDVRAEQLTGLRETGASSTRIGISMRKRTPSSNPFVSAIIDGMTVRLGYHTGAANSITLRNEASGMDGSLSYMRDIKRHDLDIVPGFVESALRLLVPGILENSGFFTRLVGARLRYTPERVMFTTSFYGQERRAYQYDRIIAYAGDSLVVPIESPRKTLDSDATINFAPFATLNANISLRSSRDLLPAERASKRAAERSALEEARSQFAGMDLGWEASRSMTSSLNWRPLVSDWIRPTVQLSTRFGTERNPSYIEVLSTGSDTTAILQRRFQADRQLVRTVDIVPHALFKKFVSDTTGFAGGMSTILRAVQPISYRINSSLGSQFERETTRPDLKYQFALGDLEYFRLLGIDSAVTATETGRREARTGLRFLKTAQFDLAYTDVELQSFDARGGARTQNDVTWPNAKLTWSDLPVPGFMKKLLPNVSATASYERVRKHQVYGLLGSNERADEEHRMPFTLRLVLPHGLSAQYTGSWITGGKEDPTGDVETNGFTHDVNLTGTFRPPGSMANKMQQPIRTNLRFTQNTSMQCRFRQLSPLEDEASCIPYIDYRNQTVNFTIDTYVSQMTVGLQMSYTGRQDYVGIRRGSSQFQLGLFGEFNLNVGQLPAPAGIR